MATELLPKFIRDSYEIHEWKHASSILRYDFQNEWDDIIDVLSNFRLKRSWIASGGGNKSPVSKAIDSALTSRGWVEKQFQTEIVVDGSSTSSPTHIVDCFKNRVALEIEWNNKDPFFDRDLNNFRLLFDLRTVSVGIIITRCDELQKLTREIGRNQTSFGASTTHMSKLLPRINGGGGGGCPLLVFGISRKLYFED